MKRGDYTLVILKPDCLKRRLVGEVLSHFERLGLWVREIRYHDVLDRHLLEAHYDEHEGRPYYAKLIEAMRAGPAAVVVLVGPDALVRARQAAGSYDDPAEGTIRQLYRLDALHNTVHTSGDQDAADTEIALWFSATLYNRLETELEPLCIPA